MNSPSFLNQFASNPAVLAILAGAGATLLALFAVLYNGKMDRRKTQDGYTAYYVAGGVLVVLTVVALISWKAAALTLAAFVPAGLPMILGDMRRSEKQRADSHRPKRLPYRANGLVKDANDLLFDASKRLTELAEKRQLTMDEMMRLVVQASIRVSDARSKLAEVQHIQE